MQPVQRLETGRWATLAGYGLFIGMMAVGYAYNVTFIQLGLVDLGQRTLGLGRGQIADNMALLAIITCAVAVLVGGWMTYTPWARRLVIKLRLAWVSVVIQTLLTALALNLGSEAELRWWIVTAAIALGIGIPATFSMTVDLIRVRHRGPVAALITAAAYFVSAVLLTQWQIEAFAGSMLLVMLPGCVGLTVLAFVPLPITRQWAQQHQRPEFARGRFVVEGDSGQWRARRRLFVLLLLMFGIYFIDSLGFLRILETPVYLNTAWQSPDADVRLFIGVTHTVAALVAGVLYQALNERPLFLWIFGIFALVHFMYTLHDNQGSAQTAPLAMPMLYAIAVSLYTVVNFALWADLSTPKTISLYTAVGVAFSGWTATFLSTALALNWQRQGLTVGEHLRVVDAIALLFFVAMLVTIYLRASRPSPGSVGRKDGS